MYSTVQKFYATYFLKIYFINLDVYCFLCVEKSKFEISKHELSKNYLKK